ncbi:MAG TPA: protein phosphatase 2C domain-containing protein [Armatimonadota bacterium]
MNAILDVACWSLEGARHTASPGNQDSILSVEGEPRPNGLTLFDLIGVVADGVSQSDGGQAAAQSAARAVADGLLEQWEAKAARIQQDGDGYVGFEDLLIKAFHTAHSRVRQEAPNGKAVLAAVCVQGDRLLAGNVGDTRIYLSRGGALKQLSEDHRGARGVTALLGGSGSPSDPKLVSMALQEGDTILLCSDGFYEPLNPQQLEQAVARFSQLGAEELAGRLRALWDGVAPPPRDDTSLLVVRVGRLGQPFWSGDAKAPRKPIESRPARTKPQVTSGRGEMPVMQVPDTPSSDTALRDLADRVDRLTRQLADARLLLFADKNGRGESPDREAHRALVDYLVTRLEGGEVREEDVRALSPRRRRRGMPLENVVILIVAVGVAAGLLGWAGHTWLGTAPPAEEKKAKATFRLQPRYPGDFVRLIEQQVQGDQYVVTYVARPGEEGGEPRRRVAVYKMDGDGKPYAIVTSLPAPPSTDAPARRGTRGRSSAQ